MYGFSGHLSRFHRQDVSYKHYCCLQLNHLKRFWHMPLRSMSAAPLSHDLRHSRKHYYRWPSTKTWQGTNLGASSALYLKNWVEGFPLRPSEGTLSREPLKISLCAIGNFLRWMYQSVCCTLLGTWIDVKVKALYFKIAGTQADGCKMKLHTLPLSVHEQMVQVETVVVPSLCMSKRMSTLPLQRQGHEALQPQPCKASYNVVNCISKQEF